MQTLQATIQLYGKVCSSTWGSLASACHSRGCMEVVISHWEKCARFSFHQCGIPPSAPTLLFLRTLRQVHVCMLACAAAAGLLAQYDGVKAGYAAASPSQPIPDYGFSLFGASADLEDVVVAYPPVDPVVAAAAKRSLRRWDDIADPAEFMAQARRLTHCSGLVKLNGDFSELWFGHSTWSSYYNMLRTYHHYSFALQHSAMVGREVSFSGYPVRTHAPKWCAPHPQDVSCTSICLCSVT